MTSKSRRRIEQRTPSRRGQSAGGGRGPSSNDDGDSPTANGIPLAPLAGGFVAAVIVFVNYYPSDSVSVEKGDALWFGVLALVAGMAALVADAVRASGADANNADDDRDGPGVDACCGSIARIDRICGRIVAFAPWCLACWMAVSAWAMCPPGSLRPAVNEVWFWFSVAAVFTAARLVAGGFGKSGAGLTAQRCLMVLLVACGVNVAVHGLQQEFVGLPELRKLYSDDPESVLKQVGISAPEGSAARMVFENRLADGGPTGTFALANSLAGVLALAATICSAVVVRRWRSLTAVDRIAWTSAIVVCAGCLIATRSRSAVAACLLGMMVILVCRFGASAVLRSKRWFRGLVVAAVVTGGIAVVAGTAVVTIGDAEFVEQAVPSLKFRFQYWRSTFRMVGDSPLFGSGPGNFQSIYERYRESSAHEQIAEPHNFAVETLASGGIPAGLILAAFGIAGLYLGARHAGLCCAASRAFVPAEALVATATATADPTVDDRRLTARWCLIGAAISLALVWILGTAVGLGPDTSAQVYALPVALIVGFLLWTSADRVPQADWRFAAAVGAGTVLLHLTVAGGWTVPGVSVCVWIVLAVLLPARGHSTPGDRLGGTRSNAKDNRFWRLMRFVPAVCVCGLLGGLYLNSLLPHQDVTIAILKANDQQQRGRPERAEGLLLDALAADPWDVEPALQLCGLYRWRLTAADDGARPADRAAWRSDWQSANQALRDRAGDDPAIHRLIADAQLHLFQRYGQPSDLSSARETMARVVRWSPSNQNAMAQYAAILDASGQPGLAQKYAEKAEYLSKSGGNIERHLSRQLILVPASIGPAARAGEIRQPASKVLANLLGAADVVVK